MKWNEKILCLVWVAGKHSDENKTESKWNDLLNLGSHTNTKHNNKITIIFILYIYCLLNVKECSRIYLLLLLFDEFCFDVCFWIETMFWQNEWGTDWGTEIFLCFFLFGWFFCILILFLYSFYFELNFEFILIICRFIVDPLHYFIIKYRERIYWWCAIETEVNFWL